MSEKKTSEYCEFNSVCDAVRFLGDFGYAILPKDLAHQVGDLNKTLLGGMRWLIDKKIEWIDARLEGGDKLREEWQASCKRASENAAGAGI